MRRPSPAGSVPTTSVGVRSRGAIAIEAALLLILLALLPQTLDLGDDARRFPLVTTLVLLVLLTLDLVIELVPAARSRLHFLESDIAANAGASPEQPAVDESGSGDAGAGREPQHREFTIWGALAWLTGAGLGMYYVGYLVTTPVFLALFFLWARVPIKVAVAITVVLSLFNFVVFYQYLGLR